MQIEQRRWLLHGGSLRYGSRRLLICKSAGLYFSFRCITHALSLALFPYKRTSTHTLATTPPCTVDTAGKTLCRFKWEHHHSPQYFYNSTGCRLRPESASKFGSHVHGCCFVESESTYHRDDVQVQRQLVS